MPTPIGDGLFAGDPFHQTAPISAGLAFLGFAFTGALNLGVKGSTGDLTFGLDAGGSVAIDFRKPFSTGADQPTLSYAAAQLLSGHLIPASVGDLRRLQMDDIYTVSGQGSLHVTGGFRIAIPANPLRR